VGRLPLDTLEQYVRNTFSNVPNNKLPGLEMAEAADWGSDFNCIFWVKPIYDLCEVSTLVAADLLNLCRGRRHKMASVVDYMARNF